MLHYVPTVANCDRHTFWVMGNSSSSVETPVVRSPFHEQITRLFEELQEVKAKISVKPSATQHLHKKHRDGLTCIRRGALKGYFQCLDQDDFGQLLFSQIAAISGCGRSATELSKAEFIDGFEQLMDQGSTSGGRLKLYTTLFSDGENTVPFTGTGIANSKLTDELELYADGLDQAYLGCLSLSAADESERPGTQGLVEMFQISKRLAMKLSRNSGHSSETRISADMLARSVMTEASTEVEVNQCTDWVSQNCPRIFNSVHVWVINRLNIDQSTQENVPCLPTVAMQHDSCSLLNADSLWLLSTSLSPYFLSCAPPELQSGVADVDKLGGTPSSWSILYDSEEHGQSLNRFKHHCMGYRGPTVTLMRLGKDVVLAVAVDVEWRESTSSWGNSDCRIIQLCPTFKVLRTGPNIVFFNAKARGLPSGIVFGQTSRPCVTLDPGLTSAKLHYQISTQSLTRVVERIEVWGCGGDSVKQKQQQQQQWERRQAEKLQQVKRPGTWDENPDKSILEMAGITTSHSQR